MARIELPSFAGGTHAIAQAVASTSATTVVGGVKTVQALRAYGLPGRVSHLSTVEAPRSDFWRGASCLAYGALRGVPSAPDDPPSGPPRMSAPLAHHAVADGGVSRDAAWP